MTIKGGYLSATAEITITRDDIVEADETFDVEIVDITSATGDVTVGSPDSVTLTILDDDEATVDVLDLVPAVVEGTSGTGTGPFGTTKATVTVQLTGDVQDEFTVDLAAFGDTSDQEGTTGFVTFPAGSTDGATQTFDVFITADNIVEPEESFTVDVTSITALGDVAEVSGGASGEVTIEDDDAATISVLDLSMAEGSGYGGSAFDVLVELTGYVQEGFSFDFDTTDGTAVSTGPDADFMSVSTSASFAAGLRRWRPGSGNRYG